MAKKGEFTALVSEKTSLYQKKSYGQAGGERKNHWQLDGCKTGERRIKLILCFRFFYNRVFHLFFYLFLLHSEKDKKTFCTEGL